MKPVVDSNTAVEILVLPIRILLVSIVVSLSCFWSWIVIFVTILCIATGRWTRPGMHLSVQEKKRAVETLSVYPSTHAYFASKDGVRIHYATRYQDQPKNARGTLIFVHGFPSFWYSWKEQLDHFYDLGYNVIAPDLRGYGDSDAPILPFSYTMRHHIEDLDELFNCVVARTAEKPILVGHDWGGVICSHYAAVHGGKIKQLILMNTSHYVPYVLNALKRPKQLLQSFYTFVFQVPILGEHWICQQQLFRVMTAPRNLTVEDRLALMYQFRTPFRLTGGINTYRAHGMWHLLFASVGYLKKYIFATIDVDTLMIWAKNDGCMSADLPMENKKWFKKYSVNYLKDSSATHWLISENANEVNRLIHNGIK